VIGREALLVCLVPFKQSHGEGGEGATWTFGEKAFHAHGPARAKSRGAVCSSAKKVNQVSSAHLELPDQRHSHFEVQELGSDDPERQPHWFALVFGRLNKPCSS
jgi:hypothetical protein